MSGRNGLISTAELADILGQADLRLFDGTTYLEPAPDVSYCAFLAWCALCGVARFPASDDPEPINAGAVMSIR